MIALLVTALSNADALYAGQALWQDANLRNAVAASAAEFAARGDSGRGSTLPVPDVAAALRESELPIGWYASNEAVLCPRPTDAEGGCSLQWTGLLGLAFGWLVTTLAASLGAVFGFDVLGGVLQLRGSGTRITTRVKDRTEESGEQKSRERQRSSPPLGHSDVA